MYAPHQKTSCCSRSGSDLESVPGETRPQKGSRPDIRRYMILDLEYHLDTWIFLQCKLVEKFYI